jgi:hypothetical protein
MCSLSFNGGLFDQHAPFEEERNIAQQKEEIEAFTPGEVPVEGLGSNLRCQRTIEAASE